MIGFEHYVSGSEIGRKLQDDPEELAYALIELFDDPPNDLGEELAECLGRNLHTICANLRTLAADIEAAK